MYKVGDRAKLLKDMYDDGEDHHPPGYLARAGEILLVKEISTPDSKSRWPIYIGHEGYDGQFGVMPDEIEKIEEEL